MSLKLSGKTAILHFLDLLPKDVGYSLYHQIQERMGNNDLDAKITSFRNSYSELLNLIEKADFKLEGKNIIEIGSGWLPIMPYFLKYFGGAKDIKSYDLNRHYSKRNIDELNRVFSKKFSIDVHGTGDFNLPQGIIYFPEVDLGKTRIDRGDLIFSRFVLEHVRPEDIEKMHLNFINHVPDAYIVHLISPSDHRAYVDKNLSLQDFLKFSQEEWDKIQTKFDYNNRLRLPQYIQLFETLGYEILHLEYDVSSKTSVNHQKFMELEIHDDFKKYSDEELMAGAINLVLRYKYR